LVCYQYRKERLIIPGIKGQYNKGKYPYEEYHKYIDSVLYKKCAYHDIYFPDEEPWFPATLEYFYNTPKNKSDGLYPECKRCSSIRAYQRKKDNVEHYKKYDKLYYIKNKNRMKDTNIRFRVNNKEYFKQKGKEYRQSDRGKEKYKIYGKKRHEKKHEIYDVEWKNCKKYFDNQCAYCGLPIEEHYFPYKNELKLYDFHKEHVIDEGKNDLRNCVPSCNTCNTQKHKNSLNNWYNSSNSNYTYERYFKIYQWIRYDHKKYIMPKRRYKNQRMTARIKEIERLKISIDRLLK